MKYVEEADFGPGPPIHTLYVVGVLDRKIENLGDSCKWISKDTALGLLLEVSKYSDRIGPFVFIGLLHDSTDSEKWKDSLTTLYQEYPPGVMLFPMKSITGEPFHTTNLVVMVPHNVGNNKSESSAYITYGDALLMDPGCCTQSQSELADLVGALPKKLVVFVTHHHYDHIDGLSIVQKYNPDSILLAHKNTMSRIGKGTWSLGYTSISGGEKICIGGQTLEAIFAPDYFLTTYKFLELSPHVLIPMHGRINLWPKRMLCGYIKNRRARELSILKAIESGARTLFDITAKSYANVDTNMWLPASLNVQIHVDHLAQREKLPKDFSMKKFQASCHHLRFLSQWIWIFLMERKDFSLKVYQVTSRLRFLGQWTWRVLEGHKVSAIKVLTVLGIAGLALSLALKCTY
ncbi:uncharacterized protein LOC109844548 isoform X2 [Asparagus officinalis]|uniref:uncharacterized protein LOC109844548 isoform X2 n=1 Tax=Asparagus officinalis TaxID=4686 RepID=UPI00098E3635|nr:uncharacterized protein LOC109844548 isoform X2 [Asparagus officinalis]